MDGCYYRRTPPPRAAWLDGGQLEDRQDRYRIAAPAPPRPSPEGGDQIDRFFSFASLRFFIGLFLFSFITLEKKFSNAAIFGVK